MEPVDKAGPAGVGQHQVRYDLGLGEDALKHTYLKGDVFDVRTPATVDLVWIALCAKDTRLPCPDQRIVLEPVIAPGFNFNDLEDISPAHQDIDTGKFARADKSGFKQGAGIGHCRHGFPCR